MRSPTASAAEQHSLFHHYQLRLPTKPGFIPQNRMILGPSAHLQPPALSHHALWFLSGSRVYSGVLQSEPQPDSIPSATALAGYSRQELLDQLRDIASAQFARESAGHTLQPTAVVHEAWIRIAAQAKGSLETEAAFRQWAGRIVRQVLIDYARVRTAQCRDIRRRAPLTDHEAPSGLSPDQLLQLSDLLDQLSTDQPRMASVVEMRYFGGMCDADIANRLGISSRTVRSDWAAARAWLYGKMNSH